MSAPRTSLALCLQNTGYEVSLERRKLYRTIPDRAATRARMIRVVDESGDDYLYPASFFARLVLPIAIRRALLAAG